MASNLYEATFYKGGQPHFYQVLADSGIQARILAEEHAEVFLRHSTLSKLKTLMWGQEVQDTPKRLLIDGELIHPGAYVGVVGFGTEATWWKETQT